MVTKKIDGGNIRFPMMFRLALLVTTLNCWTRNQSEAFYLPAANPQSFGEGNLVELKINKMTSIKTLMPIDYYRLPFCQPEGGPKLYNENLGELLAGDHIESSPYLLRMKEEMYCQQLCISNLGMPENKVTKAIRLEYHNNWIVDNLPAASKMEDINTITTRYWQGSPVGFIATDNQAYVYNHVNIEIIYHPVEWQEDAYRIVRFTVEPFSIKHNFTLVDLSEGDLERDFVVPQRSKDWVIIKNPIASCNYNIPTSERSHTHYDMVNEEGRFPQPANGKVLFTYDVIWQRRDDLQWASRWDIYLTMDNAIPAKVHWLSVANGTVIVLVLSAIVITIMTRNLRRNLAEYNPVVTDEEKADVLEEKGWKSLHADIFRPPTFSPLLLSVCCGTGAQFFCMALFTIVLAALGFLSQAKRGAFLMAVIVLYSLSGAVSGYVTARLYKTLSGMECQKATICTALGLPGLFFILFVFIDLLAWSSGSTYAVPLGTILVLLGLWLGVASPLVFLGAHFGYKQEVLEFPVPTSSTLRQIPDQPWFVRAPFTLLIAGILPFGACYSELLFIMAALWMDYYYSFFWFLLLLFIILIVASAEISLLINYCQLCHEDYHWWWRSFGTAGSTSIYIFAYSCLFFEQFEAHSFGAFLLYFGYMGLLCLGLFLMTGFMGVMASLWFNMILFRSVKVS